jgi:hypothetical protein
VPHYWALLPDRYKLAEGSVICLKASESIATTLLGQPSTFMAK